jgi:hypothetical protein
VDCSCGFLNGFAFCIFAIASRLYAALRRNVVFFRASKTELAISETVVIYSGIFDITIAYSDSSSTESTVMHFSSSVPTILHKHQMNPLCCLILSMLCSSKQYSLLQQLTRLNAFHWPAFAFGIIDNVPSVVFRVYAYCAKFRVAEPLGTLVEVRPGLLLQSKCPIAVTI